RRHAGVRERGSRESACYRRGFVPGREPVARRYRGKLRRRQAPVDASSSYKGGWSHATSPAPGQDACPHGGNAKEQAPPCVDANTQPGYNSPCTVRDHLHERM
ncbi:hypothetical protein ALC62_13599, partial [Cyphomyrmex costatus]